MSEIENEKPKRRKKAKTAEVEIPVAWEATSELDFAESVTESVTDAAAESVAEAADESTDSITRFEELARRVADTVSKNSESAEESILAATEAPEEASEMEQIGLGALESELEAKENDAELPVDGEPAEFVEHERLMSIIESLLFSTDKPVSVSTMKQIFKGSNIRTKDISRAIDLLASEYASAARGVTLEEINGGYQLRTKPDNSEYLRRLAKVRPFRLSGPALEVMAIVAYKQPITKHEIDEIRGVESGHLLRALMERGMVSFGEKSELPGKPMTYQSTRKFLETFGLRNIRELPSLGEIDELLPEGIGEVEEEKESLSDLTDRMSQEITSTYSEGEDELLKINEQLKAVDTTSEFFEQEKVRERERRDRERAQDIRERIVLGDAVEEKDKRWLDRYEAKLNQPPPIETLAAPDMAIDEAPQIGEELEALSEEAAREQKATADSEDHEASEEILAGDDAEIDELAVNADWDEDSEPESGALA